MATRHPALIPLARDHHEGLLLALRLRQGDAALPRRWSHDRAVQADLVVRFTTEHLLRHFAVEERLLFPLAAVHVPGCAEMCLGLIEDHRFFRETAEALSHPEAETPDRTLTAFGERLERHIRTEDRELFPAVEREVPEHLLQKLLRGQETFTPLEA